MRTKLVASNFTSHAGPPSARSITCMCSGSFFSTRLLWLRLASGVTGHFQQSRTRCLTAGCACFGTQGIWKLPVKSTSRLCRQMQSRAHVSMQTLCSRSVKIMSQVIQAVTARPHRSQLGPFPGRVIDLRVHASGSLSEMLRDSCHYCATTVYKTSETRSAWRQSFGSCERGPVGRFGLRQMAHAERTARCW